MPLKGITVSGQFKSIDNKPIKQATVKVYQLDGIFKATVLDTIETDDNGSYRFKLRYEGGKASILLIAPGKTAQEPLFSKFITLSDRSNRVEIPSPPLQQKKRKFDSTHHSTLKRRSRAVSIIKQSIDEDAESSTVSSHQEIFHPLSTLLSPSESHDFFFNSFYCNPRAAEENSEYLTVTSSELKLAKFFKGQFPEVKMQLMNKSPYQITEISLRVPGKEWETHDQDHPDFSQSFAQALNTLLQEGLVDKLIPWCQVLPTLYAQAFLSSISEINPLQKLLSPFLSEGLLIEKHMGITHQHPLLQLRRKLGIHREEIIKHTYRSLGNHPFERADYSGTGAFKDPLLKVIRKQVIEPAVGCFFDSYRETIGGDFWKEIYQLSQNFSILHPLNEEQKEGWWQPFIQNPLKQQPGEMKRLQEWCIHALLVSIMIPILTQKHLKYFINPYLSPLPPQKITELESYSALQKVKILKLPHIYPPLKSNFNKTSEVLMGYGLDIEELTI